MQGRIFAITVGVIVLSKFNREIGSSVSNIPLISFNLNSRVNPPKSAIATAVTDWIVAVAPESKPIILSPKKDSVKDSSVSCVFVEDTLIMKSSDHFPSDTLNISVFG